MNLNPAIRVRAPGRVNLIGDHTDYMGGLAMPVAIQLETRITAEPCEGFIALTSDAAPGEVRIELPIDPSGSHRDSTGLPEGSGSTDTRTGPGERAGGSPPQPEWGRYVEAVALVLGAGRGLSGTVESTIPSASGLSSSAALEVAVALALGDTGSPLEVSQRTQRAEFLATGVPCGIMDQLAITAGRVGHALLMDFATLEIDEVRLPDEMAFWVIHSGQQRRLAGSAYAERRRQCEAAQSLIGPLPQAGETEIGTIPDPVVRSRARHVRSECLRVVDFAAAMRAADLEAAGELMTASHASLRDDFEVSTPALDELVAALCATPGVYGARLTGAGFGGCVVALADSDVRLSGWRVEPSAGASVEAWPG